MAHEESEGCNVVTLRGKVTSPPEERTLPSGTTVVALRMSVPRAQTPMTEGSRQSVDWVDLSVWGGRVRTRVGRWRAGDLVEVEGSLRRRVQRHAQGMTSRLEVEVLSGRMIRRA